MVWIPNTSPSRIEWIGNSLVACASSFTQTLLRSIFSRIPSASVIAVPLGMHLRMIFLVINRYLKEGNQIGTEMLDEIERATHYFRENYNQNIVIEQYAEEHLMTPCWFIQNFKQVTKVTPMQYIMSLRINNAMNMLDTTKYNVTQIVAIDMRLTSPMFDTFVICSASNARLMHAIKENIKEECYFNDFDVKSVEGSKDSNWVLVDLGDIVCHIFNKDERNAYNLEKLWGDLPRIDISGYLS